jgi:hypothetical protein
MDVSEWEKQQFLTSCWARKMNIRGERFQVALEHHGLG